MNKAAPPTYTELVKALQIASGMLYAHVYCTLGSTTDADIDKIGGVLDRVRKYAPEMLNQSEA